MENKKNNNEQEAPFALSEVFISRTDRRGIIRFCNDTFIRISEYEKSKLQGSPHNIIRHEFMPRTIFYLFWNKILAGLPIVAYVKNKSKSGRFYWVLATAIPTANGILSIRIKPSTELLKTVAKLYEEVLDFEKNHDFLKEKNKCLEFVLAKLKTLGFESYEEFMIQALNSELISRDHKLKATVKTNSRQQTRQKRLMDEVKNYVLDVDENFKSSCPKMAEHFQFVTVCAEACGEMRKACGRLENLSVNMSIAAHKLGKNGSSLSVISSNFHAASVEIVKKFSEFEKVFKEVGVEIYSIIFNTLMMRTESIMMSSYCDELLAQAHVSPEDINELETLISSLGEINKVFCMQSEQFINKLNYLTKDAGQLKSSFMKLSLIRTGGKLEGSRTEEIHESFVPFITEMENFSKQIQAPINKLHLQVSGLLKTFMLVKVDAQKMQFSVAQLARVMELLKNLNSTSTSQTQEAV